MGYTTEFRGRLALNKKLTDADRDFLLALNETRRMKRKLKGYGIEGEFYVGNRNNFGQEHTPDVVDYNEPPKTQPGLWCKWKPTDDGLGIEWDGREKAYDMPEWLVYLLNRYLVPRGYLLNGVISAQGEEFGDIWSLRVTNDIVQRRHEGGSWELVKFDKAPRLAGPSGTQTLDEKCASEPPVTYKLGILKAGGEIWLNRGDIVNHLKSVKKDYKGIENVQTRVILQDLIEKYSMPDIS